SPPCHCSAPAGDDAQDPVALAVQHPFEQPSEQELRHQAPVPPTVMLSSLRVGWPTPTGTDWPSLPQVPTPLSSARSLPTMDTLLIASGPLPIRVAPLIGAVMRPSSIRYASLVENTNLPLVMST